MQSTMDVHNVGKRQRKGEVTHELSLPSRRLASVHCQPYPVPSRLKQCEQASCKCLGRWLQLAQEVTELPVLYVTGRWLLSGGWLLMRPCLTSLMVRTSEASNHKR